MQFIYIDTEDAADEAGTHAFGLWFPVGEPVEVEDERAVLKLIGHQHFEAVEERAEDDGAPAAEPKKRGRPRKVA